MQKTLLTLLICLFCANAVTARAEQAAVLVSRELAPYQQALRGIQEETAWTLDVMRIQGDPKKGKALLEEATAGRPDVFITIGSEALEAVKQHADARVPLVYTMVFNAETFEDRKAVGILIRLPVPMQFREINTLFPEARKVGVLYDPVYSTATIKQARRNAGDHDLELVPLGMGSQQEAAVLLDRLRESGIDVLWSIVDQTVAHPSVIQTSIQFSLDHRIPYIAISEYHVKAGALAAFSADFVEVGRQAAEAAEAVLAGDEVDAVMPPRRINVYVNRATQKHLGARGVDPGAAFEFIE